MPATPRPKFGVWLATALVVGNIIGSAIFVLPASLAPFGWNAALAWLVALVGALCLAWVFAQLARHLPDVGGSYGFMRLALGDSAAFLGAWGYLASIWSANAAITIGGANYSTRLLPPLAASPSMPPLLALAVIWVLTWVNLRGRRAAGGVQFVRDGRLPFSWALALCVGGALVFEVWAFYGSGVEALVWGGVLIAAGWPLFVIARRTASGVNRYAAVTAAVAGPEN